MSDMVRTDEDLKHVCGGRYNNPYMIAQIFNHGADQAHRVRLASAFDKGFYGGANQYAHEPSLNKAYQEGQAARSEWNASRF